MIDEHFAILAAVLPLTGFASYIRDTLRAKTQPNRVSWSLWAIAPLMAFAAELTRHTPLEIALLTLGLGLGPLLVVAASLADRGSYWKLTRFDLLCGGISAAALVLWALTGRGDVAIAFSILADGCAALPTIRKSWSYPGSESAETYLASAAGSGITLLAIQHWTFTMCGFPLYVVCVCGVIVVLITWPRTCSSRSGGEGRRHAVDPPRGRE
jgi:hypothetical protein